MIGSLRGRVLDVTLSSALLEIAGVGYRVLGSPSMMGQVRVHEERLFYIHDHIREDAHDLYGFLTLDDLALFEQLLTISGVGPKVAMTILGIGPADTVRRAIMAGNLETLTSVPGVGKKTAQKIILELKGQLVDAAGVSGEDADVMAALQSLGYPLPQAREAIKHLPEELKGTSERVREALKWVK